MHRSVIIALAAVGILAGCGSDTERPIAAGAVASTTPAAAAEPAVPRVPRSRSVRPARISVPAIGVDAPVIELGLESDGSLEVPEDYGDTGWWSRGAKPGARGPAVIVGHVDSKTGPAVFYELNELKRGDEIVVSDRAGRRVSFAVDRRERHPKDDFPTAAVYGPTERPELRLVTCSGDFDDSTGHYLDNTIVFAHAVDT